MACSGRVAFSESELTFSQDVILFDIVNKLLVNIWLNKDSDWVLLLIFLKCPEQFLVIGKD